MIRNSVPEKAEHQKGISVNLNTTSNTDSSKKSVSSSSLQKKPKNDRSTTAENNGKNSDQKAMDDFIKVFNPNQVILPKRGPGRPRKYPLANSESVPGGTSKKKNCSSRSKATTSQPPKKKKTRSETEKVNRTTCSQTNKTYPSATEPTVLSSLGVSGRSNTILNFMSSVNSMSSSKTDEPQTFEPDTARHSRSDRFVGTSGVAEKPSLAVHGSLKSPEKQTFPFLQPTEAPQNSQLSHDGTSTVAATCPTSPKYSQLSPEFTPMVAATYPTSPKYSNLSPDFTSTVAAAHLPSSTVSSAQFSPVANGLKEPVETPMPTAKRKRET